MTEYFERKRRQLQARLSARQMEAWSAIEKENGRVLTSDEIKDLFGWINEKGQHVGNTRDTWEGLKEKKTMTDNNKLKQVPLTEQQVDKILKRHGDVDDPLTLDQKVVEAECVWALMTAKYLYKKLQEGEHAKA